MHIDLATAIARTEYNNKLAHAVMAITWFMAGTQLEEGGEYLSPPMSLPQAIIETARQTRIARRALCREWVRVTTARNV